MGTAMQNSKETIKKEASEAAGYMSQAKDKLLGDDPLKAIEEIGEDLKTAAGETLDKANAAMHRSREDMIRAVKERPLSAVAIAFFAGAGVSLATAYFLRRGRTH